MRMTVYGNNATCPEADGACSCFLIEADGGRILLDMGNGSLAKLQKDVDLAALDLKMCIRDRSRPERPAPMMRSC